LWLYFAAILGVAIVGKFASSMIAARVMGLQWREAIAIGALLNTRGLVELVILNIGYDLSVISQEVFSLMVLMALVTTATTTPVLKVIYQKRTPMGPS
jgi:Kef-type K+ transport system membrane component KefB